MRSLILILIILIFSCNSKKKREESGVAKKEMSLHSYEELSYEELEDVADSLYQNNAYSEAVDYYSKLISNDSLNGKFFYRRGYSYGQLLTFDSTVLDYEKSANLGYREYDAYYSLGIIYKDIILNDSLALHYLNKALNEDSSSQVVKNLIFDLKNDGSKSI